MEVLQLVMAMVEAGIAYCVQGNHDNKLYRKLEGRDVQVKHGLEDSLAQLEKVTEEFKMKVKEFLKNLDSHLIFDHNV